MHVCRVHLVNSETASIPFAFPRCRSIRIAFLVAVIASSSSLMAQEERDFSNRNLPSYPNPFRTKSNSTDKTDVNSSSRELPLDNSASWVDVIRLTSLPPHIESPVITAISVSPNGDLIAAAGDDHVIRIVNLTTGKTQATLTGHLDWVQSVEFSPSGLQLASCGNDGTLRIWSLGEKPKLISKKSVEHALMTLTYIDDDCIYVAGFSNRIYQYQGEQSDLSVIHACDCRDIRSIVSSPDRKWIAFGGRDGVLRVRRVDLAEKTAPPVQGNSLHSDSANEIAVPLHFERIRTLQFSTDGNQITSVGEDRRIVHYDLVHRVVVGQTEIGGGKLLGLCQLDTHLFAIAGSDNTIRIFSDTDKQVQAKLVGHDGSVSILKCTQKHLISGSFDTTIRIWDIDRAIATLDNQGRYIHPVAAQFEDSGAGAEVK